MLKQMFERIARGEKLNPLEQEKFSQIGERLQNAEGFVSGQTHPGSQSFAMKSPVISKPVWGSNPLHTLYLNRTTDVAISSGVDTLITWEATAGEVDVFKLDTGGQNINFILSHMPFSIHGNIAFASNATGYRNAKILLYDKDNVLIGPAGGTPLFSLPGFAGTDNVFPFSYPITEAVNYPITYFNITVGQTSGGNLNLLFANMGVSIG